MSHIAGLWRLAAGYLFGTLIIRIDCNFTKNSHTTNYGISWRLAGGQLDYTNLVFKLYFLTPFIQTWLKMAKKIGLSMSWG